MTGVPPLVDHLFRHTAGRMVATLTGTLGADHLDLAEEVVQDAMLKALQIWSIRGVPDDPAAWLFRVARNRAIDRIRRRKNLATKLDHLRHDLDLAGRDASNVAANDDALSMIFLCCHPVLSEDARVGLTLKVVGGFSVSEIARAFLTTRPTVAQRLVRAKRRLREQGVVFEMPHGPDLADRQASVLNVLYLMFNEGYSAHEGDNLVRADLCGESIRLATLLTENERTDTAELRALLALMCFQSARLPARLDEDGAMVLLDAQDRSLWDRAALSCGFRHLERSGRGTRVTRYHLEAGIAAEHAVATTYEETNWSRVLDWYDRLLEVSPSPIVSLNRAVAVAMVQGASAGVSAVRQIAGHGALKDYYLLPGVLGDLYVRLGRFAEALEQYRHALHLTCTEPEKRFLRKKLQDSTEQSRRVATNE